GRMAAELLAASVPAAAIAIAGAQHRARMTTPPSVEIYTSTREITSLLVAPGGTLWVGSRGGLLRREPGGGWRKFTRRDGLPAHEVISLALHGGEVVAKLPGCRAVRK